jgi:hypothetical protein
MERLIEKFKPIVKSKMAEDEKSVIARAINAAELTKEIAQKYNAWFMWEYKFDNNDSIDMVFDKFLKELNKEK